MNLCLIFRQKMYLPEIVDSYLADVVPSLIHFVSMFLANNIEAVSLRTPK